MIEIVQVSNDPQKFQVAVNARNKELKGWAMQSHVTAVNGTLVYTAVIFYGEK